MTRRGHPTTAEHAVEEDPLKRGPPPPTPESAGRRAAAMFGGSIAFGIELGRLERALALRAFPVGERRFEVAGGEEPHFVDLGPGAASPCDCADHAWRGAREGPCKHVLRARLAEGDSGVILVVAALAAGMREYARGLERALRPEPIRLTAALKRRVAVAVRRPLSALAFLPAGTGAGAGVSVHLGDSGPRLGMLVGRPGGVEFVPAGPLGAEPAA